MVVQSSIWRWPGKTPTDDLIQLLPVVEDKGIDLCVCGLHRDALRLRNVSNQDPVTNQGTLAC